MSQEFPSLSKEVENQWKDTPHGWIQWKGTDVCMDVRCECGVLTHIDDTFCYYIRCGACGRTYECGGHIKLFPVDFDPWAADQLNQKVTS